MQNEGYQYHRACPSVGGNSQVNFSTKGGVGAAPKLMDVKVGESITNYKIEVIA